MWQRYNFESKSQLLFIQRKRHDAVFNVAKIQFWKQITTVWPLEPIWKSCIQCGKDTILKANHNHNKLISTLDKAVFNVAKIQFWKQITTYLYDGYVKIKLYSMWQRYNFESKSQHKLMKNDNLEAVFNVAKIQFWKQITTVNRKRSAPNSCIQCGKDTILKANHNIR